MSSTVVRKFRKYGQLSIMTAEGSPSRAKEPTVEVVEGISEAKIVGNVPCDHRRSDDGRIVALEQLRKSVGDGIALGLRRGEGQHADSSCNS